jgi:UDP-N-acetylmuramoyl-L-alanyl-D-glutamate--2,6-diaminopimelate ligase
MRVFAVGRVTSEITEPAEHEVLALEQDRAQNIEVRRPTRAPFPWADSYLTIGVTGTNGKTSTTRLIASALQSATRPVLSETTIGYEFRGQPVNVPRTLHGYLGALARAARLGARHAAVEVTSQALSRGYAKMWRFDVGVFTNLSNDHLSQHGSWEHYLASKAQLFVHLGPGKHAVFNAADEASTLLDRVTPSDVKRYWYAVPSRGPLHHPADLAAARVLVSTSGTQVQLEDSALAAAFDGELQTTLVGEVFAENLLAAACAAVAAGISPAEAKAGLARCPRPAGRFEILHEKPTVAIDYAHTPDALYRTCATGRSLVGQGRLIVVFGAGGSADKDKREPMGRAVGQLADLAFITNDNPRNEAPEHIARSLAAGCRSGGRASVEVVLDRKTAIERALAVATPHDCVVIAGKGHEATQTTGDTSVAFSDADVVRAVFQRS